MSDRDDESGLARAYRFVPLPEGNVPTTRPPGHHRYRADSFTGMVSATLTAVTPLHVASGQIEPRDNPRIPLVKAHFRSNGKLAIPGTSLKGCVRSIAEAISHAYIQVTRSREIDRRRYLPPRQNRPERLDAVQRIFGAFGYQGALSFADAPLSGDETAFYLAPQLFAPRTQYTQAYFDGGRPKGRKFYFHGDLIRGDSPLEVCPVGSRFALTLQFSDLTPAELGLVLAAMGQSDRPAERFRLKLGGGKPAGLGSVEIDEVVVSGLRCGAQGVSGAYTSYDPQPEELAVGGLVAAAREAQLIDPVQIGRLLVALDE